MTGRDWVGTSGDGHGQDRNGGSLGVSLGWGPHHTCSGTEHEAACGSGQAPAREEETAHGRIRAQLLTGTGTFLLLSPALEAGCFLVGTQTGRQEVKSGENGKKYCQGPGCFLMLSWGLGLDVPFPPQHCHPVVRSQTARAGLPQ